MDKNTIHALIQNALNAACDNITDSILAMLAREPVGVPAVIPVAAPPAAKPAKPAKPAAKPATGNSVEPEFATHFSNGTRITNTKGKTGSVTTAKDGTTARHTGDHFQVFVQYDGAPCPMWVNGSHLVVNGEAPRTAKPAKSTKTVAAKKVATKGDEPKQAPPVEAPKPETKPEDRSITKEGAEVFKGGHWHRRNGDGSLTPAPDLDKKYAQETKGAITALAFAPGMVVKPAKRTKKPVTATVVSVEGNKLHLATKGSKTVMVADAALWVQA